MRYIKVRAVQWSEVWKFYGSLTLLHFRTGGANDAQNVRVAASQDFVNNWIEVSWLFSGQKSGSLYWLLIVLHFWTGDNE